MNVIAILNNVLSLCVCVCLFVCFFFLNMTFKESGLFPASDVRMRVFFSSLTLLKEFLPRESL